MKNSYLINKLKILKLVTTILLFINVLFLISAIPLSLYSNNYTYDNLHNLCDKSTLYDEELKIYFQPIIENMFLNRDSAILSGDSDGLKSFYDLNKKVGQWAYESESIKIKYFSNWCKKQGVHFTKINSIIKVTKAKEKEKNLFEVICYACTSFSYAYDDEPNIQNLFKLGTCHYINLKKIDDNFIITREWYTDPLADSLEIQNIQCDDIKKVITSHKCPEFTLDERTQKAVDYAHEYCGISNNEEHLFKYNKEYKNFNPDGGDCANFASQIMFEGGHFKKNDIWCYSGRSASKAWVNAQSFKNYLINSGRGSYIAKGKYCDIYKSAFELRPGDIVAYEKKGRITHVSTVTGLDSKGYPLVTCHNTDRLLVPYDLGWSNNNITFHLIDVHY